jgi:hypothetical protein
MRARHGFLFVFAAGCWLGPAAGCSPEYELLDSGEPPAAIGGSAVRGGAGNASPANDTGGVEAVQDGGETAVGGFEAGGSFGP